MGMFDDVIYPDGECRKCTAKITAFQSKDGECMMDTLTPEDVRNFYAICPECGVWNEYNVVPTGIRIERAVDAEAKHDAWDKERRALSPETR